MTQVSGDATDRAVKLMIDGVEVLVKLTGSGAKNLATALYAYYNSEKKLKGATNLNKLLKSGKELQIFRLAENDLKEFKVQATKYGILFSAIKDTRADDGFVDVFIKNEDISKVNHVLGRMDYNQLKHEPVKDEQAQEQTEPKKENPQRTSSNTQKSNSKHVKADMQQVVKDINNGNFENLTPENWKAYLAFNSQLYAYSQGNKQRIFEQNPNASAVLSKTKWRELGRYPKQGAKGILITMPEYADGKRTGNFVDARVYDISETYGRNISRSKHSIILEDNEPEMKSEIERLKASAPVPVEIIKDLETDSFYSADDKKIYIRSDITDSEAYKAICRETQYAKAHVFQRTEYNRADNRFLAESVAYSLAVKYGVDTSDFRFDCIPDPVNGLDGKDVGELVDSAVAESSMEIKKAENNLDRYKTKDRASVKKDLKAHKQAIERNTFKAKDKQRVPKPSKGKER